MVEHLDLRAIKAALVKAPRFDEYQWSVPGRRYCVIVLVSSFGQPMPSSILQPARECNIFLLASATFLVHGSSMSKTTTQEKSKRGRKPVDPKLRRSEWIGAAVTSEEKRDFRRRAEDVEVSDSVLLRRYCGFPDVPKKNV